MKSTSNFEIVYILGAGRSGTTVLSILLGNDNNTFDAGEVIRIPELNGEPRGIPANNKTYKLWHKISNNTIKKSKTSFNRLLDLSKKHESHQAFLSKLLRLRKTPVELENYNKALFQEISKITNAQYIIDASKYPGRALLLRNIKGLNIKFIYFKRNPFDVINSFQKKDIEQPRKNILSANLYYFTINLFCNLFLRTLPRNRKVTVKYEDLIKSKKYTLNKINNEIQTSFSLPNEILNNKKSLSTGMMFDGNRLRLKQEVFITSTNKKKKFQLSDIITFFFNKIWYL